MAKWPDFTAEVVPDGETAMHYAPAPRHPDDEVSSQVLVIASAEVGRKVVRAGVYLSREADLKDRPSRRSMRKFLRLRVLAETDWSDED